MTDPVLNGTGQSSDLGSLIRASLLDQGFMIHDETIVPPDSLDKDNIRKLHAIAVRHKVDRATGGLRRHEPRLLERVANGSSLDPNRIRPRLVEVMPDSEDELPFRYVSVHWSIYVSSGYGRRSRFLVIDEQNDALIGIIGLDDPVFAIGPRDRWVGWSSEERRERLHHVMDAFVLGAIPPYSSLLCGKLVAMLATSAVRVHGPRYEGGGRSSGTG